MCGCERINSIAHENNAKTLTLRSLELLSLSSAACFTRAATGSLSERTVWARTITPIPFPSNSNITEETLTDLIRTNNLSKFEKIAYLKQS